MCGLIATLGLASTGDVYAAADGAARRGPHSHGWASNAGTSGTVTRGSGPLPGLPRPSEDSEPFVIIGHSRLATDTAAPGALPSPTEGQPVLVGGWLLAHNGTAAVPPGTATEAPADTRHLARVLADGGPSALRDRRLYDDRPQALVFARLGEPTLYALRVNGWGRPAHPLYVTTSGSGLLVSSTLVGAGDLIEPGEPVRFVL